MSEGACPECGHLHPDGIGLSLCLCEVCPLPWTRYDLLSPEYKALYDRTWGAL